MSKCLAVSLEPTGYYASPSRRASGAETLATADRTIANAAEELEFQVVRFD